MKCKDCAFYKDHWCTMVTDSPDPDMERDCAHFIQAQRWVPVTERLPEAEEEVLAFCKCGRRGYICEALYIPPETYREDSGFIWDWEVCDKYNEERDDYTINPGWYERVHNWDEYGCVAVQDTVTHWMPLPEPPGGNGV